MDYVTNQSVPFKIDNINKGLQKANGLLRLKKEELELEFEVTDGFIGVMKSGVKTVTIPFSDLENIEFKKGWIGAEIILKGTSMSVFSEVPGTDVATCTLKIDRKNKKEAQDLISKARLHFSEYRLENLENE